MQPFYSSYDHGVKLVPKKDENGNAIYDVDGNEELEEVTDTSIKGGLTFGYNNSTNELTLMFADSAGHPVEFAITDGESAAGSEKNIESFLKFLNQEPSWDNILMLKTSSTDKTFYDVWNRDRLHFHASFSTSRRKFIGKRGDFYQNLSLLYPPQSNESTFYIRMTSNGIKNILLKYCEFDVQLCFIVNYRKTKVL